MDGSKNNPNWQDRWFGGAILTGFVMVVVFAALFTLFTWNNEPRTAASPQTTIHASRSAPHSAN
jgi:hypothetical protein